MSRRGLARALRDGNAAYGRRFQELPPDEVAKRGTARRAWRNRDYLVQLYDDAGFERLTVNRAELSANDRGHWRDGITWDELQRIKAEVGFGDRWAVEVFPPDAALVNVSNMRHLWVLPEPPAFGWHLREGSTP